MKNSFLQMLGCSGIILAAACHNPQTAGQQITPNSDSLGQDKTRVVIDTAEQTAFRTHEEELIEKNNEKIAKLKDKIRNERRAIAQKYNTELDTLHAENSRMEYRLNAYKQQTKSDWETFRYDFNRDMDSLGRSISRFTERNMKAINKEQQ